MFERKNRLHLNTIGQGYLAPNLFSKNFTDNELINPSPDLRQ